MSNKGGLSEEDKKYAAEKRVNFLDSKGVEISTKPGGYWLKCKKCGKEWDPTSLDFHGKTEWECPNRCNRPKLTYPKPPETRRT